MNICPVCTRDVEGFIHLECLGSYERELDGMNAPTIKHPQLAQTS